MNRRVVPRATYRLQFSPRFGFREAAAIVPYLAALGVSHVYASPYLKARAGSPHGYDITDYGSLNPEIGDETDFRAFTDALVAHGMGQILDFVPNHMGVGRADNSWWLDVLEWGRDSPFARYFDIDWEPAKSELRGKVLLPFLGDHYGVVLEAGELQLAFDAEEGSFSIWYHEHRFPVAPRHYPRILVPGLARLVENGQGDEAIAALEHAVLGFRALNVATRSLRGREARRSAAAEAKAVLAAAAKAPGVAAFIAANVALFNGEPGVAQSFRHLHRLLERQSYRLSFWRVAADEINYRRFFDINELAAVRMELPELFVRAHAWVLARIAEGRLDGLRIDHIDGLFDPEGYLRRLRRATGEASGGAELYLVVEKILARHESLREGWPVEGTTGYEALNLINGLFVDPAGLARLQAVFARFTGERRPFDQVLAAAKRHVLHFMLAGEVNVLANRLSAIAESNWRTRDFTLNALYRGLEAVLLNFPVYRTYVGPAGADEGDRRDIDWAVAHAGRERFLGGDLIDFIHAVLTTDLVRRRRSGFSRARVIRYAMQVQQVSGPVMAKSLEDTSFYRYPLLMSLNEVGGDPRHATVSPGAFHHHGRERARRWPHAMVATATHDTKRGEDARLRIDVLSELPAEWRRLVRRLARLNQRWLRDVEGERAPSALDEYAFYQAAVGHWPMTLLAGGDEAERAAFVARIGAYLVKVAREAKLMTSWAYPDEAYEAALTDFAAAVLDPDRSIAAWRALAAFATRIAPVAAVHGLAQVALKLTAPGVPDIYQGCELWDFSFVDPDNRRPVDFAARHAMLAAIQEHFHYDPTGLADALWRAWPDGRAKLFTLWRLLKLRRERPAPFAEGDYRPLEVTGALADHVVAFARGHEEATIVVAVPRLIAGLPAIREGDRRPGNLAWGDTALLLPEEVAESGLRDVFTARKLRSGGAPIPVGELLAAFPVACLVRSDFRV